jgi:hypothetical protein
MFSVALNIINFVFAFMAGVVLAAAFGYEWWLFTFILGFVLWNVLAASIVFVIGVVFMNDIEGGK